MDMCLYRLGRSRQSCRTVRLLPIYGVLFSFTIAATAASAASSIFHYTPSGFSYEVSLRSYEGNGPQPTRQTNTPPQALSRAITAPVYEDTIIPLSATNTDDASAMFFLTSLPAGGKLYQYAGKARGALIQ